MRGNHEDFFALKSGQQLSFVVVGRSEPYCSHYVELPSGTKKKVNCHGEDCPFCKMGIGKRRGIFAVALLNGNVIKYIDITYSMYRAIKDRAVEVCPGEALGDVVKNNLVSITKTQEKRSTEYYVEIYPFSPHQQEMLASIKSGEYRMEIDRLNASMMELIRPGNMEEDGDLLEEMKDAPAF